MDYYPLYLLAVRQAWRSRRSRILTIAFWRELAAGLRAGSASVAPGIPLIGKA